jgi:OmpA-OmpF porin, OOP family
MATTRSALRLLLLAITLQSGAVAAQSASALGFALDRFDPATVGSQWFVLDSVDSYDQRGLATGLVLDGAVRPLVIYRADEYRASVVSQQHVLHLGASAVLFRRLRLGLNLPLTVYADGKTHDLNGTSIPGPSGAVAGDVRIDADVRLLGSAAGPLRLAVGVAVFAPSGSRAAYSGDDHARVEPRLLAAGDVGRFAWATRVGFEYRALESDLGDRKLGSELRFGAAAGVRLLRRLLLGPELYGSTVVTRGSASLGTTPIEALLGIHYSFAAGLHVGLAGGAGLTRGVGSPQARWLLSLAWAPGPSSVSRPNDRDGDGIPDPLDACPDQPGPPTSNPKTNGCPPPDLDDLPIEIQRGRCLQVPDAPGCPNADRDGDGIPDQRDACPDQPGPPTGNPKTNGCPVRDRDGPR